MLLLEFIVNVVVAMSLNTFTSIDAYKAALFLYFLPHFINHYAKYKNYKAIDHKTESCVSLLCSVVCGFFIFAYMSDSLKHINIDFQKSYLTYEMLISGITDSFLSFESFNTSDYLIVSVISVPICSLILFLIPRIRNKGYNREMIISIIKKYKLCRRICLVISILVGVAGIAFCHFKSIWLKSYYGSPQYYKYFLLFTALGLLITFCIMIKSKKNTYLSLLSPSSETNSITTTIIAK